MVIPSYGDNILVMSDNGNLENIHKESHRQRDETVK